MRALVFLTLLSAAACGHLAGAGQNAILNTVDVVDDTGRTFTLAAHRDKAVVIDFCAAWSDPCLLNAQALHRVHTQTRETHVKVVSILLDSMGEAAVRSYQNVLALEHEILLPGPAVRSGTTSLGPIDTIPRLLILAPGGGVIEDVAGKVISADGILNRLRTVLPPEAFVQSQPVPTP